jgi:hypothetical protein
MGPSGTGWKTTGFGHGTWISDYLGIPTFKRSCYKRRSMKGLIASFSEASFFKQFIFTFFALAIISLAFMGLATIDPTAKGIALNFLPWVFLSVIFVIFFRIHNAPK